MRTPELGEAAAAPKIKLQVEIDIRLTEGIHHLESILHMHIAIGRAMHQEQSPGELRLRRVPANCPLLCSVLSEVSEVALGENGIVKHPI